MRGYHDKRRTRGVRPFVVDHSILHPFVAELRATERLKGYAEAFPAPARVSEPALPLLLASLYEELDRPLVLLAPEDQDARDAAEGAAWFLGDERVAMLPSRGVHWGSGLEPAPHLVGERARALDVLAAGGLVAASAAALVEQMRAFSPFTQRALHPVEAAVIYPAVERRLDLVEPTLVDDGKATPVPTDLVRPVPSGPDLVWQADEVRTVWEEEGLEPVPFGKAALLDTLPAGQPFAFEAQRPALVARGLAEAENELAAFVRSGQRVVVAFPHLGEALRQKNLLRRIEARVIAEGEELPREPGLMFAVTPARRGFVWRDLGLVLLPDTQVFRKRPPRERRVGGRALQSFADLRTGDFVVHEDHGVGKLLGFETKEVAGVTRDYLFLGFRGDDRLYVPHEQLGKVSRYIGAD